MSLRSRCAIAVAAGALLATAATVTPAVANDDWGQTPGNDGSWQSQNSNNSGQSQNQDWGGQSQNNDQRFYQGVVTTDSLALRSAPTRGSQVIRYASRGEILNIFCKVGGPSVHGNPLWYQIADGTWAWGPARFIDNIGPAPRWC
ncbi:SH3 domain-containing protein [Streptomyces sp. NBC_01352]|uniref:SH3 domain-containing protein n=1 Tax=Streptomyces plumbiresistens TaxID=511811 RepID=A0ABP7Q6A8_9ACTN|nr:MULTISPECIES: SH3 domain-containing protein [unclassified Streptomyces]MCX4697931.1 SH3 domain-containing protein [Streptomyces sp. NBC_01373]